MTARIYSGHSTTAAHVDLDGQLSGRDAGLAIVGEAPVTSTLYERGDPRRHGAMLAGANERATLANADVSALGVGGGITMPRGTLIVEANLTVTSPIRFRHGAKVKPLAGVTITFLGPIDAGTRQIFDVSAGGTISFAGNDGRLAGVRPQWWGTVGDGVTNDDTPVNAFWAAVCNADVREALFRGKFAVTEITASGNATSRVVVNATLNALGSSGNPVLTFNNAGYVRVTGTIKFIGPGGSTYGTRTRKIGMQITNSPRIKFTHIYAQFFLIYGISVSGGNSTLSDLGNIETYDCGATGAGAGKLSTTYSARSDTGGSGSLGQLAVLTVGVLPDTVHGVDSIAEIGGMPHVIRAINVGASQISVYPWPDLTLPLGTEVNYLIGAGVYADGTDQNVLNAESIDASRCGVAYRNQSLYGGSVKRVVTQSCGVGITFGHPISSQSLSHTVNIPYFENNVFDVLQISTALLQSVMIGPIALNRAKCFNIAPRSSGNVLTPAFQKFGGVAIVGDRLYFPGGQAGSNNVSSSVTVGLEPKPMSYQVFRINTFTVNLQEDADLNRLFGYSDVFLMAYGSGGSDQPTGTWTFFPVGVGYTVMGAASFAVSGMAKPTLFHCYLFGTDWRVRSLALT